VIQAAYSWSPGSSSFSYSSAPSSFTSVASVAAAAAKEGSTTRSRSEPLAQQPAAAKGAKGMKLAAVAAANHRRRVERHSFLNLLPDMFGAITRTPVGRVDYKATEVPSSIRDSATFFAATTSEALEAPNMLSSTLDVAIAPVTPPAFGRRGIAGIGDNLVEGITTWAKKLFDTWFPDYSAAFRMPNPSPVATAVADDSHATATASTSSTSRSKISDRRSGSSSVDSDVSRLMADYWTTFAAFGDPNGQHSFHSNGYLPGTRPGCAVAITQECAPLWPRLLGDMPTQAEQDDFSRTVGERRAADVDVTAGTDDDNADDDDDNVEREVDCQSDSYFEPPEAGKRVDASYEPNAHAETKRSTDIGSKKSDSNSSRPRKPKASGGGGGEDDDDDTGTTGGAGAGDGSIGEGAWAGDGVTIRSSRHHWNHRAASKASVVIKPSSNAASSSSSSFSPSFDDSDDDKNDVSSSYHEDSQTGFALPLMALPPRSAKGLALLPKAVASFVHQMVFDEDSSVNIIENDCLCNAWNELGYKF
jgi:hypothetical protein